MIVAGHLLYQDPVQVEGLMFVGDPHITSARPGRRKDPTWPDPVLRKLEHCVEVANQRGLAMILLGDLFDDPFEKDEALKTRVSRILKALKIPPIANVGNHDIANSRLSDGDSLAFLAVNDTLDAVAVSGPVCVFDLGGVKLGLGMTPYGQEIPKDVTDAFTGVNAVLWVTHHDIAFEETYPGAVNPFPVEGCKLIVNGHVHTRKKPVLAGATTWLNPGNINRLSIDVIDHMPCAWVLDRNSRFEPVELPHESDVFDLTGRLVDPTKPNPRDENISSAFVTLLQAEDAVDTSASADGGIMLEEIEQKFERDSTPENVRTVVRDLLREAVARKAAA